MQEARNQNIHLLFIVAIFITTVIWPFAYLCHINPLEDVFAYYTSDYIALPILAVLPTCFMFLCIFRSVRKRIEVLGCFLAVYILLPTSICLFLSIFVYPFIFIVISYLDGGNLAYFMKIFTFAGSISLVYLFVVYSIKKINLK